MWEWPDILTWYSVSGVLRPRMAGVTQQSGGNRKKRQERWGKQGNCSIIKGMNSAMKAQLIVHSGGVTDCPRRGKSVGLAGRRVIVT